VLGPLSPHPAASQRPSSRGRGESQVWSANSPLTARELEVLRLIADGQGNKEVAKTLGISVSTVKFHVQDILEKLSASDRTQAAVKALRRGLL
jgi:two-component system, NarL family, response regulator LiaR